MSKLIVINSIYQGCHFFTGVLLIAHGNGLETVVVCTYQSVSVRGGGGVDYNGSSDGRVDPGSRKP